jgi:hypothetical protein
MDVLTAAAAAMFSDRTTPEDRAAPMADEDEERMANSGTASHAAR